MNQSIAVVGAGICGLFTGLSLARKGFDVTCLNAILHPRKVTPKRPFFLAATWRRPVRIRMHSWV